MNDASQEKGEAKAGLVAELAGRLHPDEVLWIHSMGKRFKVLGMFADNDEGTRRTNRFCETNTNAAVIATIGGVIFVANKYDGLASEPPIIRALAFYADALSDKP